MVNLKVKLSCIFVLINFACGLAAAPFELSHQSPILLSAKSFFVDRTNQIITAQGDVIVSQNNLHLYADQLTFDEKKNLIKASKNVRLEEPGGVVLFVDEIEITGDLKDGLIDNIKMLLSDDSKLVAARGKRVGGVYFEFERVIYSPCLVCRTDPNKPPLWQLKARHIQWNQETRDIEYTDAALEFFGIPLLYTPYLRHPDPKVEKRTGFLVPAIGGGSDMGAALIVPYFINFAPNKDLTLTPMIGTKAQILMAEYRHRIINGAYTLKFSGASTSSRKESSKKEGRWHFEGDGQYNLTKNWRLSASVKRASDKSYTRRFRHLGLGAQNTLQSEIQSEGFFGRNKRNYTVIKALAFQGLRNEDEQKRIPYIAPYADIQILSDPLIFNSQFQLDTNLAVLSRRLGTKMRRLSVNGSWSVPFQIFLSDAWSLTLSARGDIYHVEDFMSPDKNEEKKGTRGRFFPQATLNWQYPWVTLIKSHRLIFGPIASLILAPRIGKNNTIPNEDSRIFELDDANLLSSNRQAGLDVIDSGSRVNYGLIAYLYGLTPKPTSFFFGQSFSFNKSRETLENSGLGNRLSDLVGRLNIYPHEYLTLRYRARFDNHSFGAKRHELSAKTGPPILNVETRYIYLSKNVDESDEQGGNQISINLNSQFAKHWSGRIGTTRELGSGGGSLSHHLGLTYSDECFVFDTLFAKTFYKDRDIKPGIIVWFSFHLKNLGTFTQSHTLQNPESLSLEEQEKRLQYQRERF